MSSKYLIFTDLDATLLNHDDYSYEEAKEALERVKKMKIPLIIATSKTFAEVESLQKELGVLAPCIIENGAGIYIPSSDTLAKEDWHKDQEAWIKVSESKSYLQARVFLNAMKSKYKIEGFGDMSVETVMHHTGLDFEAAENAKKRDYTEPFLIEDVTDVVALSKEANALGFDVVKGGRFFHLITLGQDKSKAMLQLKLLYEEYHQHTFNSIALGDSNNDFTMLQHADIGILIPKYDGTYAPLIAPNIIKASFSGSKGWNSEIIRILDEY